MSLSLDRRRLLAGVLSAPLMAATPALIQPAAAQTNEGRFLRIGTGGVNGTYFIIGSVLADALSAPVGLRPCRAEEGPCGVPGLLARAQSTAGSVANVKGLVEGSLDSAFVQADVAYLAWQAADPFAGQPPARSLRTLASLYPETMHVVVRGDSTIRDLPGLRGRRVAVDEPGSGTLVDARLVLRAFGITEADLVPAYIKGGAALTGLRQGSLDAMMAVGGEPMPVVAEAIERLGCRLLPLSGPEIDRLLGEYPFLVARTVPGGTYGVLPDTPTVAVGAQWLVTDAMAEAAAYELVRVLFAPRTLQQLALAHPQGRRIAVRTALAGLAVPLHPGAARFFREQGVLGGN